MPPYLGFLYFITISLNIVIGALVLFQNPRRRLNRIFFSFIVSVVGWQLTLYLFYYLMNPVQVLFFGRLNFVFAELIATTLFLLCLHFPVSTVKLPRWLLPSLLMYTFGLAVITQFTELIAAQELITGRLERETIFGDWYLLFVVHFAALTVAGFYLLFRKLRILTGVARVQTWYLFIGLVLSIAFGSVTNILLPLVYKNYELQNLGLLSTFFLIGFTSYAIVKHRLMDVRFLVARTISYSILILLLGGIYAISLFLLGNLLLQEAMSTYQYVVSIGLALVLAFTFQPLSNFVQQYTDRVFFKGKYDVQEVLSKINRVLISSYVLSSVLDEVGGILATNLRSEFVKIILFDDKRITHKSVVGIRPKNPIDFETARQLERQRGDLVVFDDLEESKRKELLRHYSIDVCITLKTNKKVIGIAVFGRKLSGDMYSGDDLQLVELLAPQLAIAVENAKGIEEISQFNLILKEEVSKATEKLRSANQRLLELDKLKDEFVSIASHELRSPMVSIRNYIWMVLNGKAGDVNTKQREYLKRAYDSTTRLSRLVNSMLNLSRIESGRIILSVQDADIKTIIKEVIGELSPKSDRKAITIAFHNKITSSISGDEVRLPSVVMDVDKIKEVLVNLIGNSLKFTPSQGKISISLSADREFVRVAVKDTGVGLNQEQIPQLFKKFSMLRESYSNNATMAQGTGLGLYISKSIIELHGGKIWVESEGQGKGSTFYFTVPRYSEERLRALQKSQHNGTDAGIIHSAVTDY